MSISVGTFDLAMLLRDEDPSEHGLFEEVYQTLSDVLVAHGLKPHREPRVVPDDVPQLGEVDSFSPRLLHRLRRAFAYVRRGAEQLPDLADANARTEDFVLRAEYESAKRDSHLIHFSDVSGFYVPQRFPEPLTTDELGSIGSSNAVLEELIATAPILDIAVSGEGLSDSQVKALGGWQEAHPLGPERVAWFAFYESARKSLRFNTAIRLG